MVLPASSSPLGPTSLSDGLRDGTQQAVNFMEEGIDLLLHLLQHNLLQKFFNLQGKGNHEKQLQY